MLTQFDYTNRYGTIKVGEIEHPEIGENGLYISLRVEHRAYGGPEEGGWYYTSGITHASVTHVASAEELRNFVSMVVENSTFNGFRGKWRTSDGTGDYTTIHFSEKRPVDRVCERPRYE